MASFLLLHFSFLLWFAAGEVCPGPYNCGRCDSTGGKLYIMCNLACQSRFGHDCTDEERQKVTAWFTDEKDGKACCCGCSCMDVNTKIAVAGGWTKLRDIKVGSSVLTLSADKNFVDGEIASVGDLDLTDEPVQRHVITTTLKDGKKFVTSGDHLWITPDYGFQRADCTHAKDHLLTADLEPKEVLSVENTYNWRGNVNNFFFHKLTAPDECDSEGTCDQPSWVGHVYNSDGLLSGDMSVQNSYSTSLLTSSACTRHVPVGRAAFPLLASPPPGLQDGYRFFCAEQNEGEPRPIYTDGELMAREVVWHYTRLYPSVKLEVQWDSPLIQAWSYRNPKQQVIVSFAGGLLRHPKLTWEAVDLIAADLITHAHMTTANQNVGQAEVDAMASVTLVNSWWGTYALDRVHGALESLLKIDPTIKERKPDFLKIITI